MPNKPTELSLEARAKVIGGSEAPVILGLSPWESRAELWMRKKGLLESKQETLPMQVGTVLEDLVASLYETRTPQDCVLIKPEIAVHPAHRFIIGHIDRMVYDVNKKPGTAPPLCGLECKTANPFAIKDWGEEMTDEIPEMYIVQVQHYMGITGLSYFDVAVLIGNSQFRVYRVHNSAELISRIIEAECEFHESLKSDEPPEIDGTDAYKRFIEAKYPKDSGVELVIGESDPIFEHIEKYWRTDQDLKRLDKEKALARNLITDYMGEASRLKCPLGSIFWKCTKDTDKVDWKAVAGAFQAVIAELDPNYKTDAVIRKSTTLKVGTRSFRPTLKGE